MKTIFTYNGKRYSYKIIDGKVKTYEIMGINNDEIDTEEKFEQLTDEDWKEISQFCEELEKND